MPSSADRGAEAAGDRDRLSQHRQAVAAVGRVVHLHEGVGAVRCEPDRTTSPHVRSLDGGNQAGGASARARTGHRGRRSDGPAAAVSGPPETTPPIKHGTEAVTTTRVTSRRCVRPGCASTRSGRPKRRRCIGFPSSRAVPYRARSSDSGPLTVTSHGSLGALTEGTATSTTLLWLFAFRRGAALTR